MARACYNVSLLYSLSSLWNGTWALGGAVQWDLIYCNFKQNTIRTFFKIYLFDMELN